MARILYIKVSKIAISILILVRFALFTGKFLIKLLSTFMIGFISLKVDVLRSYGIDVPKTAILE